MDHTKRISQKFDELKTRQESLRKQKSEAETFIISIDGWVSAAAVQVAAQRVQIQDLDEKIESLAEQLVSQQLPPDQAIKDLKRLNGKRDELTMLVDLYETGQISLQRLQEKVRRDRSFNPCLKFDGELRVNTLHIELWSLIGRFATTGRLETGKEAVEKAMELGLPQEERDEINAILESIMAEHRLQASSLLALRVPEIKQAKPSPSTLREAHPRVTSPAN